MKNLNLFILLLITFTSCERSVDCCTPPPPDNSVKLHYTDANGNDIIYNNPTFSDDSIQIFHLTDKGFQLSEEINRGYIPDEPITSFVVSQDSLGGSILYVLAEDFNMNLGKTVIQVGLYSDTLTYDFKPTEDWPEVSDIKLNGVEVINRTATLIK